MKMFNVALKAKLVEIGSKSQEMERERGRDGEMEGDREVEIKGA